MDNPVKVLTTSIYKLFVDHIDGQGDGNFSKQAKSVIRVQTVKLKQTGDLNVGSEDGWRRLLTTDASATKLSALATLIFDEDIDEQERNEACRLLVEKTTKWVFPLAELKIMNGHGIVFLQRAIVANEIMQLIMTNEANYGTLQKERNQRVLLLPAQHEDENNELTQHRVKLIHKVLYNLLQHSSWTLCGNEDDHMLEVKVASVTTQEINKNTNNFVVYIKCGIVTELATKKMAAISTEEYHSLRATDIYLMARHKYGIRTKLDDRFKALLKRLGEAAATVDLLEVKHTSPVNIIRNGTGSTRGASFILYNSARLETLLRTFDNHVSAKIYPPLPALHEIDFTMLTEEEEWQLIYVYIFAFPQLIETCLERMQQGLVATHLIVRFLNNFMSLFSAYYRRVRILTEARDELLPVLFARIFLLKAVRIVLNKTLALFDISPITFM